MATVHLERLAPPHGQAWRDARGHLIGRAMDYEQYRGSDTEQARTRDLLRLTPARQGCALDVGAREGFFSVRLAERFDEVVALDLTLPTVSHPRVRCVAGTAERLAYSDRSFDFVFCAEVLEHIPPAILPRVCAELERVARGPILIGVPFRQDTRVGRTTCASCGHANPPWGHLNSFDERRLRTLFPHCDAREISFVGRTRERTNALAAALMDLAGNPYGTYDQEESCLHCGKPLLPPPDRALGQKVLTRLSTWARKATTPFAREHGNWIHVLFARR